jgi:hypothetical protein
MVPCGRDHKFNGDAWDKVPTLFSLCFGFWGCQIIDYFEFI